MLIVMLGKDIEHVIGKEEAENFIGGSIYYMKWYGALTIVHWVIDWHWDELRAMARMRGSP